MKIWGPISSDSEVQPSGYWAVRRAWGISERGTSHTLCLMPVSPSFLNSDALLPGLSISFKLFWSGDLPGMPSPETCNLSPLNDHHWTQSPFMSRLLPVSLHWIRKPKRTGTLYLPRLWNGAWQLCLRQIFAGRMTKWMSLLYPVKLEQSCILFFFPL